MNKKGFKGKENMGCPIFSLSVCISGWLIPRVIQVINNMIEFLECLCLFQYRWFIFIFIIIFSFVASSYSN